MLGERTGPDTKITVAQPDFTRKPSAAVVLFDLTGGRDEFTTVIDGHNG
jgi:hypothetical protein